MMYPVNKRNSSFELLRIVAMLMIIAGHIVVHCVYVQLTDAASIARLSNGLFNHPLFYKKLWLLSTMLTFGCTSNAIFILISGYFMVLKENKIRVDNIAKKLLYQQGFAAVFLVASSSMLYYFQSYIGVQYISLCQIALFNGMSWFVGYYFLTILCAFLFLNKLLAGFDHSKYTTFLIVLFAFIQLSWSGGLADSLASGLRTLLTGIFLYSLGGYIKRYNPFSQVKFWVFPLIICAVYCIVYLSSYNATVLKIEDFVRNGSQGEFIQTVAGYGNFSIVTMLVSVCLFELFTRIHIPENSAINFLGAATFMVYLIHDNAFFYSIWDTQDWITMLYYHPYQFLVKLSVWTLSTFAIGVIAYCAYLLICKIFTRNKKLFIKPKQ